MNPISTKTFALGDLFTEDQLERAEGTYENDREHFHQRVLKEIVEPRMEHINKVTGQENDTRYVAYMLEAVFSGAIANQPPTTFPKAKK